MHHLLLLLTERLGSLDHQTSAEAAHIYVQELMLLHNSLSTWPSKTLVKGRENTKMQVSIIKKQSSSFYTKLNTQRATVTIPIFKQNPVS